MKTKQLLTTILVFAFAFANAQSVSINTTGAAPNPAALLHVDVGTSRTQGLLVTGTYNATSTVPDLGQGSRLMFYPGKAAFRAGAVFGTEWNDANVGFFSTAIGLGTIASGDYSTAIGNHANASGTNSNAMGNQTTASGEYSTAMGFGTDAIGFSSSAIGNYTLASGNNSTAMGLHTTASGNYSTAMGNYASTNLHSGSFVYGDHSTLTDINCTIANQFMVRAVGGTIFYSNSGLTAGVSLAAGGGSWASVSDINRKENLGETDAEDILLKVSSLPITTWNYKAQHRSIRHIGPMAQDFYAAFHLDGQSDTTINTLDIDGVNMSAIQALKTRTDELKNQNAMLNKKLGEVAELKNEEVKQLKKENESLKQSVAQLQTQFDEQQNLIVQSLGQLKKIAIKQKGKENARSQSGHKFFKSAGYKI